MLTFPPNPLPLADTIKQKTLCFNTSIVHEAAIREIILAPGFANYCLKRQAEFLAGRLCSKAALEELGFNDKTYPLKPTKQGGVRWPEGVTGSITHSGTLARAAVASMHHYRGIGIDSEKLLLNTISSSLAGKILTEPEKELFTSLNFISEAQFLSLVFSAKESVFKCLFPLCGKYFYFHDAAIEEVSAQGEFKCTLLTTLSKEFPRDFKVQGRFALDTSIVHTAVFLEA